MRESVGLGNLKLPLKFGKYYTVFGGPFMEVPEDMFGVKMASEIRYPHDVSIPTRDFNVPSLEALETGLLKVLDAMGKGEPVYVGCMAGRGRTGLFLAVLSKVFGIKQPVEYVREYYYSHAVENNLQYDFVEKYEPSAAVVAKVRKLRLKSIFRFKKNLTEV